MVRFLMGELVAALRANDPDLFGHGVSKTWSRMTELHGLRTRSTYKAGQAPWLAPGGELVNQWRGWGKETMAKPLMC